MNRISMKKILNVFVFIFLIACTEKQPETIPADVLSQEKMTAVLVDVHLVEATMNLNVMSPGNIVIPDNYPLSIDVLKKHQITKKQYFDSFIYYTQHPDVLNKIYEEVINDLSKLQAKVANEK